MIINQSNTIRAIAAVAFLALGSGPAPAQVLFTDNFESVSIGSAPNNGALPGDWTNKLTSGSSFLQVTNLPAPPEGTQFLQLHRAADGFNPGIGASLASAVSNQEFVVSLFAQTPSSAFINLAGAGFNSISLTKNTTDFSDVVDSAFSANDVLTIMTRNNGSGHHIYSWNSGTSAYTSTGLGWTVGQWDQLNLRILPGLGASGDDAFVLSVSNLVSGIVQTTGRVTFDGPTVASSVAPAPNITRAYFGTFATDQDYYLDDVVVALPEPTVAMLLGLGGLLLVMRRRQ